MPSSMLDLLESSETLQAQLHVSMQKDGRSEQAIAATVKTEQDPGCGLAARTPTWFVTEVPRCPRISINGLQIALAHLADAQAKIHNRPRITAGHQAACTIQITDLRLGPAGGHTLGTALNGCVWVGQEASRECIAPAPNPHNYLSPTHSTLTILRCSRTSINVLRVALAYWAGAKPEIHNQLHIAADRQAELAIQIAGIPQHVRDALSGMDWLRSEFTPLPLINPRQTFLVSLVLASKFSLDKAFSNKTWAKLSGLEALEVIKCKHALGTTLNWHLWVGWEASRECVVPAPNPRDYPLPAHLTLTMLPPSVFARSQSGAWENPTLSSLRENASPTRSSSPLLTVFTQGSTPSLTLSETSSEVDVPQGYDEFSTWAPTPEMVSKPEEMLHGSPLGYPSATMGGPMRLALEPVVQTRLVLPPFRSFDRPVPRYGPSEMVTPQMDSNLGCVHMPPVCFERASNESPLAYTDFARPWEAMSGQAHWDFDQGGVVGI
ncbi:hypothetical protein FRC08_009454 [Ceratobasidium sp. 394]|nr:hypothetical protein FRC08_009454 [Ceratobasidium sp. 394]KAG9082612.1 hypothetical protein FS749_006725 [Ceratobasidium sp. UAMH 11750]